MAETTRNYINQWIIKSANATEKTIFNLDRIYQAVFEKGEYPEIMEVLEFLIDKLVTVKQGLPILQSLFNDPRANKIEAT